MVIGEMERRKKLALLRCVKPLDERYSSDSENKVKIRFGNFWVSEKEWLPLSDI